MPRSKRARLVHTSKTKKQTKQQRVEKVDALRNLLQEAKYVYVLAYDDLATANLQQVRRLCQGSKFFFGKNTLAQLALGRTPQEEVRDGICHLSKRLKGKKALLVSHQPKSVIQKQLAEAEEALDVKLTMEAIWSEKTGFIDLLQAKLEPQGKTSKQATKKATAKRKQLSSRVNEEEMEGLQEQQMEDEENETNLALN